MLTRRVWPSRPAFEGSWSDLDPLRREVLRMLGGLAGGESWRETAPSVFPPMNVTQDPDNFYIRAEVPGIRPSDLAISAMRNRVSISGKREIPVEQEKVSYHRKERAEGAFHRTITLPTDFDADRVDATYADGILTLTLPKAEEAKPRHIAVKS